MPQETEIKRLANLLLPLVTSAAKASTELEEWRREAGRKSAWSNHVKLQELGLFSRTEQAFDALTSTLTRELPSHWGMSDWAFRPARMGGNVRWAGKHGKARDMGGNFSTSVTDLTIQIGFVAGAIAHSTDQRPDDIRRLATVGLSTTEIATYSIMNPYRAYLQAAGHHPVDAIACLLAQQQFHGPHPPSRNLTTADEIFAAGAAAAKRVIDTHTVWSAAPTLIARLWKDKRAKRLHPSPKGIRFSEPPWKQHDPETYDRVLATALALLETLPEKPGKMQAFLVNEGSSWASGAHGWCGTSAILSRVLRRLDGTDLPADVDMWRAFAVSHECGAPARRIAEGFLPPGQPVTK